MNEHLEASLLVVVVAVVVALSCIAKVFINGGQGEKTGQNAAFISLFQFTIKLNDNKKYY